MGIADHKCPSCTAPIKYNPESSSWKCEYCGNDYGIDAFDENAVSKSLLEEENIELDEYFCPDCGAKILTDENTIATFCVYCGNTAIVKNRVTKVLKPDKIVPFKTTKEQAIEAFVNCKTGKFFSEKDFGLKNQIEKIRGIYIPFWLYSGKARGEFTFSRSLGNNFSKVGECEFSCLPADASKKFDDNIMDSIEPFDCTEAKEFSISYLSGFFAEKYDIEDDVVYKRARYRIRNDICEFLMKKGAVSHTKTEIVEIYNNGEMKKYDTVEYNNGIRLVNEKITADITSAEYVLFPVWLLNIDYNGKKYTFAMNGQTGKMIGNVPISNNKLNVAVIMLFLFVFILMVMVPVLPFSAFLPIITILGIGGFIGFAFWISNSLEKNVGIEEVDSAKEYIKNMKEIS